MKIDIKARIRNPTFWWHIIITVWLTILTYFNLHAEDITTYPILFDLLLQAVSNPYVMGSVAWNIWSIVYDPTTKGLGD